MKPNGAIAIIPPSAPPADKTGTQEIDVQMLKDAVNIPNATDAELRHFGRVAQRVGLDPLKREIYMVKRWNADLGREVITHQTGIDGFRVIAERTQQYQGQTAPQWCDASGKWLDVWLDETVPPVAAKIGVYRADFREPVIAVAKYSEYCQRTKDGKPNRMWRSMPSNQIAKCAEALALRKAFPNQLSGIYASEEMAQADNAPAQDSANIAQKVLGNISETVQESVPDSPTAVVMGNSQIAGIVSHLQPFKESLGESYYYRVLLEVGGAVHSNKISIEKARKCWRMFDACQRIVDFRERLGADAVRQVLRRRGFETPQEVPTLEEFRSILDELKAREVAQ